MLFEFVTKVLNKKCEFKFATITWFHLLNVGANSEKLPFFAGSRSESAEMRALKCYYLFHLKDFSWVLTC